MTMRKCVLIEMSKVRIRASYLNIVLFSSLILLVYQWIPTVFRPRYHGHPRPLCLCHCHVGPVYYEDPVSRSLSLSLLGPWSLF